MTNDERDAIITETHLLTKQTHAAVFGNANINIDSVASLMRLTSNNNGTFWFTSGTMDTILTFQTNGDDGVLTWDESEGTKQLCGIMELYGWKESNTGIMPMIRSENVTDKQNRF